MFLKPEDHSKDDCFLTLKDVSVKIVFLKVFELEGKPQQWYAVPLLHCESKIFSETETKE